jgi:outer membrane protein assembly factor BamE
MKTAFHAAIIIVSLIFSGCTTLANHFPFVYRLDVNQGNIIDQEMIEQLRPEMTKRQVLYLLGSPMMIDVFHKNRWDYVYSIQPGGEARLQKRISLFFEDEKLVGIQGDFRPSNVPVIKGTDEVTVEVPKREIEKTFFQIIAGWFGADDTPTIAKPEQNTEVIEPNDIDPNDHEGEFITPANEKDSAEESGNLPGRTP